MSTSTWTVSTSVDNVFGSGSQTTDMQELLPQQLALNLKDLEENLNCTICSNLFIRATTLNCSHSFCEYCIKQWKAINKSCPICRQEITYQLRTLVLDECVETVLNTLPEETKRLRKDLIECREKSIGHQISSSNIVNTNHNNSDIVPHILDNVNINSSNVTEQIDEEHESISNMDDFHSGGDELEDNIESEVYDATAEIDDYRLSEDDEQGDFEYFETHGDYEEESDAGDEEPSEQTESYESYSENEDDETNDDTPLEDEEPSEDGNSDDFASHSESEDYDDNLADHAAQEAPEIYVEAQDYEEPLDFNDGQEEEYFEDHTYHDYNEASEYEEEEEEEEFQYYGDHDYQATNDGYNYEY